MWRASQPELNENGSDRGLMRRSVWILVLCIVTLNLPVILVAQVPPDVPAKVDPDDLFAQARRLAFSGRREEARKICIAILERAPAYDDVRTLLGRLYSWDQQYDQAERELKRVLDSNPTHLDARKALIDVELWSEHPYAALRIADAGLAGSPDDQELLYKKARALKVLGNNTAAAETARQILRVNPANKEARILLSDVEELIRRFQAKVEYAQDRFDKTFDPWHLMSVSLSRRQASGTVIGRINLARRFGQTATQYEMDVYPKFGRGVYAYLNGGYSDSSIFPKIRAGAELYTGLPKGLEASIGARLLRFTSSSVTIYTGSLGLYVGNYWISLRPYVTPGSIGSSISGSLSVRRYLGGADSYVGVQVGAGSQPDERYSTLEFFRLRSQRAGLELQKRIGDGVGLLTSLGFENQQLGPGDSRRRITFGAGISKRF
jgi:YaiO family outer membrane protein